MPPSGNGRNPGQPNQPDQVIALATKQPTNDDPITQLLHATFHAREALDRLDQEVAALLENGRPAQSTQAGRLRLSGGDPREEAEATLPQQTDDHSPLYSTPYGRYLEQRAEALRGQLGSLAKAYVALGIEERHLQNLESWSSVLLPLLENIMTDPDLRLTRTQRHRLPAVIERHLATAESPAA